MGNEKEGKTNKGKSSKKLMTALTYPQPAMKQDSPSFGGGSGRKSK